LHFAGWQPLRGLSKLRRPADCQSAIQQINNLRYVGFGPPMVLSWIYTEEENSLTAGHASLSEYEFPDL
jgi:hypothetical protein